MMHEGLRIVLCIALLGASLWISTGTFAQTIKTDLNMYTEPSPPSLPQAGAKIVDPVFGTTIMRLTDSTDSATDCWTIYSNAPTFNVNNTKAAAVCLSGYNRLKVWDFNATTLTRSNGRIQANPPGGLQEYGAQWSRTTANKYFACGGPILYEITIPSGTSTTWTNTVVRDFSSIIGGGNHCTQNSVSNNDDVHAFHYEGGGTRGYVAYRRSTNTVLVHQVASDINEVEIDKSGRYLVVLRDSGGSVWDLQVGPTQTAITNETFNHRAMGSGMVASRCGSGSRMCARQLATPNTVTYLGPVGSDPFGSNYGEHFSLVGPDQWVFVTRYFDPYRTVLVAHDQEAFLLATNGSASVRRYAHHHSRVNGSYDAQPKGNISMDGSLIAWTSNWGSAGGRTDVYIVQTQPASTDHTPPQPPINLRVQ